MQEIWIDNAMSHVTRGNGIVSPLFAMWNLSEGKWWDEALPAAERKSLVAGEDERLSVFVQRKNEIVLDREFAYLPISFRPLEGSNWEWHAERFEPISVTGKEVPFPKEGTIAMSGEPATLARWRVTSVTANRPFPHSLFAPPDIPDGVKVQDLATGIHYIKGRETSAAGAVNSTTSGSELVFATNATSRRSFSSTTKWVLFGCGIIAAGFGLARRIRSKEQTGKRAPDFADLD
jgi:hypothetical protein